jgi:hypothetical protein
MPAVSPLERSHRECNSAAASNGLRSGCPAAANKVNTSWAAPTTKATATSEGQPGGTSPSQPKAGRSAAPVAFMQQRYAAELAAVIDRRECSCVLLWE